MFENKNLIIFFNKIFLKIPFFVTRNKKNPKNVTWVPTQVTRAVDPSLVLFTPYQLLILVIMTILVLKYKQGTN